MNAPLHLLDPTRAPTPRSFPLQPALAQFFNSHRVNSESVGDLTQKETLLLDHFLNLQMPTLTSPKRRFHHTVGDYHIPACLPPKVEFRHQIQTRAPVQKIPIAIPRPSTKRKRKANYNNTSLIPQPPVKKRRRADNASFDLDTILDSGEMISEIPTVKGGRFLMCCSHCSKVFWAKPTEREGRFVYNHECSSLPRRQYVVGGFHRKCPFEHSYACIDFLTSPRRIPKRSR